MLKPCVAKGRSCIGTQNGIGSYLKAKTSEIREHYIRDFGAIPFSHRDPFLLLIDGEAARNLLFQFMKEES